MLTITGIMNEYKIVLIGDEGCGKTTFLRRLLIGEFEKKYIPTMGFEVIPLAFRTNKGTIKFNLWDCAGQKKLDGLSDAYYIGAHAAILMVSTAYKAQESMRATHRLVSKVKNVCGNVPFVTVERTDSEVVILDSILVDTKRNLNLHDPFLRLAQQLSGDYTLTFVAREPIEPPMGVLENVSPQQNGVLRRSNRLARV